MSDTPDTPDVDPEPDPTPDPPKSNAADEVVTFTKAEADALRRQAAEGQKAARRAAKAEEEAVRKRAEEEGRWKEIAEENERKAKEAEARLADAERSRTITAKAEMLRFRDVETAELHLRKRLSGEELDDAQLVERTLKAIAKEKDWLLRPEQRRTGAAIRNAAGDVDEKDPMRGIGLQIHEAIHGGT